MNKKKRLRRIAFISGATSGIGKASAKEFAKSGFDLIITGRRKKRLIEISRNLKVKYGIKTLPLCFDVRELKSVKKSLGSIPEDWLDINILINNAGLASGFDPIYSGDIGDWETMIDTNVKGLLYITRFLSPRMVNRRNGHIINVCSTAGHEVYPKGNVYCATKHAVDALTKAMRIDLHSFNIRVSQISPGHVEETEFALVRFHGDKKKSKIYEDFQPLKSKDVAKIIYFIASQPKHVNIQDVLVMGTQQASSLFVNRSGRAIV